MEGTVRTVTSRASPRSVLRRLAVFEGEEETGIFPSPRAYIEGESSEFLQVSEPRGKLGISSPSAYMEDTVRTMSPRSKPR